MVYVILGTGFEEIEAVAPVDVLRRAGVPAAYVGIGGLEVVGAHGITLRADLTVGQMDLTQLEMIVLPGGMGGVSSIRACPQALEAVRFAAENGKFVAAICAGPTVLADLHLTDGRRCTCFPSPALQAQMQAGQLVPDAAVVRDGMVITGTSAGCAVAFALELVSALRGPVAAEATAADLVIRPA